MFDTGGYAYLAKEITESASGDHPEFLMGEKGERVKIISQGQSKSFQYAVEGPTNPGKSWLVAERDLMRTKPLACNS